jgi:hypothetical protein
LFVDGSLDGENWTEISRETDNKDFVEIMEIRHLGSFALAHVAGLRFIRLAQNDADARSSEGVYLGKIEFFGTPYESIRLLALMSASPQAVPSAESNEIGSSDRRSPVEIRSIQREIVPNHSTLDVPGSGILCDPS